MSSKKAAGLGGVCGFGCYYGSELMETCKKTAGCEGRCRVIETTRKATPIKAAAHRHQRGGVIRMSDK